MIDPERILALALDGSDEQCVTELGMSRAQVIQRALHLAEDPAVALEYPELVQRIWARVEAGRAARSAARLKIGGQMGLHSVPKSGTIES